MSKFKYYIESYKLLKKLFSHFFHFWTKSVVVLILMVISALLQIVMPLLTLYLIDVVLPQKNLYLLNILTVVLILVVIFVDVVAYIKERILINIRMRLDRDMRGELFNSLIECKLLELEHAHIGYLQSRIDSDVDAVNTLFLDKFLKILLDVLTFLIGIVLLLMLNTHLAVICLIFLPLFALSFHLFSYKINQLTKIRQEKWALFRGIVIESLSLVKSIKTSGNTRLYIDKYSSAANDAIESTKKLAIYNLFSSIFIGLTGIVAPIIILWYGIRQIILGTFSLGGFFAFNSCLGYIYGPVQNTITLNIDIHAALAAGERILEIMQLPKESLQFGKEPLPQIEDIHLDNVSFIYEQKEDRGVKHLNLNMCRGEKVAIIGETGKGKTTIARLLLGLDIPQEGRIFFNKRDYTGYRLADIRNHIGYVSQEQDLFAGTIKSNIIIDPTKFNEQWLNEIIKICMLEHTIKQLTKGIDTEVFEAGNGLSGGEKQRIAIAQAMYRKPDFLILDESTSALDQGTEHHLCKNLLDLPWNPGLIVITHRQTILPLFNKIVAL